MLNGSESKARAKLYRQERRLLIGYQCLKYTISSSGFLWSHLQGMVGYILLINSYLRSIPMGLDNEASNAYNDVLDTAMSRYFDGDWPIEKK